jgi:hypothetical protein
MEGGCLVMWFFVSPFFCIDDHLLFFLLFLMLTTKKTVVERLLLLFLLLRFDTLLFFPSWAFVSLIAWKNSAALLRGNTLALHFC